MDLPLGYSIKGENLVCRLNKSIYGLRQASRQWFHKFSTTLTAHGFIQSKSDYSLFHINSGSSLVILLVYVDDIILGGPNRGEVLKVQSKLQSLFKLKILGDLRYFLVLEIARSASGICLSQRKYALSMLEDTGFANAKPASLPMDPNLKLSSSGGELLEDASMYRRLIGRLMYLTISRPDITYAVTKLSQYMSSPQVPHLDALHHLLRYIKQSPGQGLLFSAASQLTLKG